MDTLNEEQFERMIKDLRIDREPPAGHREELRRRMLAAYAESSQAAPAARGPRRVRMKGLFTMSNLKRVAVAAILLVAVGIGAYFLIGTEKGASIAFADVVKAVRKIQSVRFKINSTVIMPNRPPLKMSAETTVSASGVMRQTMKMPSSQPYEMVMVFDPNKRKYLTLMPSEKTAVLMEMSDMPPDKAEQNPLVQFQKFDEKGGIDIGEKQVNGRKLKGFKVTGPESAMVHTVWVDVNTRLPVEMELQMQTALLPQNSMTMTDFEWDVKVDESLMTVEPPKGYEVTTMKMNMAPAGEADLIAGLKAVTAANEGRFPDGFDMAAMFKAIIMPLAKGVSKDPDKLPPELKKAVTDKMSAIMPVFMRAWMFIGDPKNGEDWHYAGMNRKFGEAGVPVFWYHPKGSVTYRVIDADLKARDVAPEDLPTVPSVKVSSMYPTSAPASQPGK